MRFSLVAIASIALICFASTALAVNELVTLPMHGLVTTFGPCAIADPCDPGPPTTQVNVGDSFFAYLMIRNHDEVAGVQTAFDFGGLTFTFGLWDCQSNQVNGVTPAMPGGPTAGSIATAFDCVTGPTTAIIGRMNIIATAMGCVTQVESSYPFGDHVVACVGGETEIPPEARGSICVGSAGIDACEPVIPVEPTTWGDIKAQYR